MQFSLPVYTGAVFAAVAAAKQLIRNAVLTFSQGVLGFTG